MLCSGPRPFVSFPVGLERNWRIESPASKQGHDRAPHRCKVLEAKWRASVTHGRAASATLPARQCLRRGRRSCTVGTVRLADGHSPSVRCRKANALIRHLADEKAQGRCGRCLVDVKLRSPRHLASRSRRAGRSRSPSSAARSELSAWPASDICARDQFSNSWASGLAIREADMRGPACRDRRQDRMGES